MTKDSGRLLFVAFLLALVVVAVLYGPYINIWCFNTLFKLGIEYNWTTWAAMLWFNVCILGAIRGSQSAFYENTVATHNRPVAAVRT